MLFYSCYSIYSCMATGTIAFVYDHFWSDVLYVACIQCVDVLYAIVSTVLYIYPLFPRKTGGILFSSVLYPRDGD